MPGTESQKALDLLKEKFPAASADGASARVVVRTPAHEKISDAQPKKNVATLAADLSKAPQVVATSDPFTTGAVSKDGTSAHTIVTYKVAALKISDDAHNALKKAADDARANGLVVEMGGDAVPADARHGAGSERATGPRNR
ncbi:MMPL family transporter [Streptomyces sp. NBC_00343]|uniref:MMPL family transporter n=1 Tax=Streptomyces sp. NBC_00343 TaxID=2975719 RepID=UPI002E2BD262|nr:MMPL family transporter [Streptomyces sp. NBC_00343]